MNRDPKVPGAFTLFLFRSALRANPKRFRARFADEMEDDFVQRFMRLSDSHWTRVRFLGRTCSDLVRAGIAERLRPCYRPNENGIDHGVMGMRMGFLLNDARLALRSAIRNPGFSLVVVLTLTLGIGANTAIFSVVNGVLLRPLPFNDPEGLVVVRAEWNGPEPGRGSMSFPDVADLNEQVPAFERLIAYSASSMTLTGFGEPAVISVNRVTEGMLDLFDLSPTLGRDIRSDEFGADAPAIVVLGHGFWQDRFGGDPEVIGKSLRLSGREYEVVGVAPFGFAFPSEALLWMPRRMDTEDCGRGCHTFNVVGRLADGATIATARAQSAALAGRLEADYRETNIYKSFYVASLRDEVIGDVRTGLALMLGAVGLVLLIACANVATLLLVRGATRAGDTAVRSALGASRARLLAASLTESGIFALLGGLGGLVVALGLIKVLPSLAAGRIPRISEVSMDVRVLAATLVSLVLVTLLFGLMPAMASSRLVGGVGSKGRGETDGRGQRGLRGWLLAGEVALCTVLLVGSGLLIRTFQELYTVDLGYQTEGVLRFSLNLPGATYPSLEEIHGFYSSLEERVKGLPDVIAVGSAWSAPLARGHASGTVLVDGRPEPAPEEEREGAVHAVTPGWLDAMGISVIRGRGFSAADAFGGEPVALINQRMVQDHFPNSDPIGQAMGVSVDLGHGSPSFRIVGVIPDLRERTLTETAEAGLWVPVGHFGPGALGVTVRTRPGSSPVLPAIREIVGSMDASLPLYRIETLSEAVSRQIAPTRFYVILTAGFALLAAVLAAVGLYGVAAFAAAQRIREIGLRVALGADRGGIRRLVIGQGMKPALWGLAAGLLGAYLTTGVLASLLYQVHPTEPLVFAVAAFLLICVAAIAAALPAWTAARTDPMVALRTE